MREEVESVVAHGMARGGEWDELGDRHQPQLALHLSVGWFGRSHYQMHALLWGRRGAASVAVQWGAWAEAGMVTGGAVHAPLRASGFGLITPARGVTALWLALWAHGSPEVA